MTVLLWRAGGLLIVAIWVYLAWFRGSFWRLQEKLRTAWASSSESVTAVIPARDEAGLIGRAVALRRQEFKGRLRIIVADDESTDLTGHAAIACGVWLWCECRLRLRPEGKLWANAEGVCAEMGHGNYSLADGCRYRTLLASDSSSLVAKAQAGFDLVSVIVHLHCESVAERLLIPAFVFFFFMLYPPRWVPTRPGMAAAAGGCMLIRRDMLMRNRRHCQYPNGFD